MYIPAHLDHAVEVLSDPPYSIQCRLEVSRANKAKTKAKLIWRHQATRSPVVAVYLQACRR